ncbi:DNA repair protein RecN [Jatrophihabitans telluris]|uniref:DNA repair protein RecN n=1 Tax=Jatrophihabitans telluris TaxID=2038343 RepID=A0ABY4R2G1_9ACTN|nr:DNA repair protein RecN [Jatrophihabitans telluris]UQX90116.1 DNA repair protein RecN [Jatrophihabitans telluris]
MLEEIRIRGLGVISDAVLEFGPGLTVVTGETGAGKTMVLSGLALLFGGRADYSRLRTGEETASVEGRLLLEHSSPEAALVVEAGGDLDADGSLVLRRVITASGRSRAAAGGASVPATVLARLGDGVLAVHGQSDQQRLALPGQQRATVDRYAGLDLHECAAAFGAWRAAEAELGRRTSDALALQREAELLRHGLAEIAAVDPQPGEDLELARLSVRLEYADNLRLAAHTAHAALLGDPEDGGAETADVGALVGSARRALHQLAGTDAELDRLAGRLTELLDLAGDVGAELADYEARIEADPARLAATHDRRAALATLTRRYGRDLDEVLAWAAEAQNKLLASDTSAEAIAQLRAQRDQAADDYRSAAEDISSARRKAADELSQRITAELAGLAMAGAQVTVVVRPRPASESAPTVTVRGQVTGAGAEGIDEVEILLRSHPDAPAIALQRGASGGELSRVMLAIEVVLAGTDPVPTMVFDEVDAGVGGRAAVEVGRRLARLAQRHQVIVVTHLAQVAAFATRHLVVDKASAAADASIGVTRSDIRRVEGEQRLGELARMLSGEETSVARQHAAELLAAAQQDLAESPDKQEAGSAEGIEADSPGRSKGRKAASQKAARSGSDR